MIIQELNYIENAENTDLEGGSVGINTSSVAIAVGPGLAGTFAAGVGFAPPGILTTGGFGLGGSAGLAAGFLGASSGSQFQLVII